MERLANDYFIILFTCSEWTMKEESISVNHCTFDCQRRYRKSYFNYCDKQNLQPNTMTDFQHINVFSYTFLTHDREISILEEPQTSNTENVDKIQSRSQIFLLWYLNSVTKFDLLWLHHVVFWGTRGTQAVSIFWTVSWTTSSFNGTTFSVSTGVVPGRYLYFIVLEEKIRQN